MTIRYPPRVTLTHPDREAHGPVVRLKPHRPPLLEDGLVGRVQPLPHRRQRVVVVVMVTGGGVVVVVVDGLVALRVLLLPQEVGVEVAGGEKESR